MNVSVFNRSITYIVSAVIFLLLTQNSVLAKTKPDPLISEVQSLIKSQKYYTAFRILHKHDPDNADLEIFILKSNLALKYYAGSFMHQSFSFADLKNGQTLEDARAAVVSIEMFDFQINKILDHQLKKNPDDLRLNRIKGDYYFDVYRLYRNKWFSSPAEIAAFSLEGYMKVIDSGGGCAEVYDNTGVLYSIKNDHTAAEKYFLRAIEVDKKFANAYYNYSVLLYKLKKIDESLANAKTALALYENPSLKSDAAFLAAMLLDEKKDYSAAEASAVEADKLSPGNPLFIRGILILSLKNKNYRTALTAAEKFLAINPADINIVREIITIYANAGAHKDALIFLDSSEKKYQGDYKITGNINSARALYHSRFTFDKKKMHKAKSQAVENYKKIYPPDHEIFILLDKELNE